MKISKITFKVQYSIQDKLAIMKKIEELNLELKANQSKEITISIDKKKFVCIVNCNSSNNLEVYVNTGKVTKQKSFIIDWNKHWSSIVKDIQNEKNCSYEEAKEMYNQLKNER